MTPSCSLTSGRPGRPKKQAGKKLTRSNLRSSSGFTETLDETLAETPALYITLEEHTREIEALQEKFDTAIQLATTVSENFDQYKAQTNAMLNFLFFV